jgi:hypothetical protein
LFQKHIALPQQHGSWALWLGPFAVGLGVGGPPTAALGWLTLASLGGFLLLQPLTILTKVLAGRRPRTDLPPAIFWLTVHGLIILVGAIGLSLAKRADILVLGLAALPVLAWQMVLVARRAERGQMGIEVVGSGVLALAAPAAYWAVTDGMAATGWWLWVLCWLQSAGAIVYIYLRLEHRRMSQLPDWPVRWQMARRALLYHAGNVVIVAGLAALGHIPTWTLAPFVVMLAEACYGGVLRPGLGAKPSVIGVRQIMVAVAFSALMIAAYRM